VPGLKLKNWLAKRTRPYKPREKKTLVVGERLAKGTDV
jgi:hypothetical protein